MTGVIVKSTVRGKTLDNKGMFIYYLFINVFKHKLAKVHFNY